MKSEGPVGPTVFIISMVRMPARDHATTQGDKEAKSVMLHQCRAHKDIEQGPELK